MQKLSRKTRRAIKAYGEAACRAAYRQHIEYGEGASTVACTGGFASIRTTRQADAAIDAGRELAERALSR